MKYVSKEKLAYYTQKLKEGISQGNGVIISQDYKFIKEITMTSDKLTYELANYDDYKEVMIMIEKTYANSGSGNCWIRIGSTNLGLLANPTYANIICKITTGDKFIEVNQSSSNNLQTGQNTFRFWKSPTFNNSNNFNGQTYNITFTQAYADTWVSTAKLFVFGIPRNSNNNTDFIKSTSINNIVKLTQAEYNALTSKDENTIYIIVG